MAEGGYEINTVPRRPKSNQTCRFFSQGHCREGENCMYIHDASIRPSLKNNVCKYYQIGNCAYGAKCRYDHVKMSKQKDDILQKKSAHSNLLNKKPCVSDSKTSVGMIKLTKGGILNNIQESEKARCKQDYERKWVQAADFVPGQKYHGSVPISYAAAVKPSAVPCFEEDSGVYANSMEATKNSALCPYYEQNGDCPFEGRCGYAHGLICDMCHLPKLHPANEEQRRQHEKECVAEHEKEMNLVFAIQASKDKECGICLENVMSKEGCDSDKRFGILENCNHCFCLSCIRTWRFNKSDIIQTKRTCPTCRTHSDFVTPSKFWVESSEEKQALITKYKSAMQSKPCQYFKKGTGECPFDRRCFYMHALEDGTKVEGNIVKRRRRTNADGENAVAEEHSIWDFIRRREEEGGLLSFDDELSLVLLGIFQDSSDDENDFNNNFGMHYNFLNGDFLFTDSDTDTDSDW